MTGRDQVQYACSLAAILQSKRRAIFLPYESVDNRYKNI